MTYKKLFLLAFFFIFGIAFGYLAVSSELSSNSLASINKKRVDVHFEHLDNITRIGNVTDFEMGEAEVNIVEAMDTPSDKSDDKNINFAVTFRKPGDKYQFQVRVVNNGLTSSKVKLMTTPIDYKYGSYIKWNISGLNNKGEVIKPGDSKLLTIAVEYFGDKIDEEIFVNLTASLYEE